MRIRYGQYRLPEGQTELSITSQPVQNARGLISESVVTWNMVTRLACPPAGMNAALEELFFAFSVHGQDLVLENASGVSQFHQLINTECIGGTVVSKPPTYPTARKGEMVTFRTIEIAVTGRVPALFGWSNYLSYQETITIRGGGRRWGVREVNFGPGIRQLLRTNSKCIATQSGSAVGHLYRPAIPPAIWPNARVDELPDITDVSPKTNGQGGNTAFTEFSRSWSYAYEFPTRLSGSPNALT